MKKLGFNILLIGIVLMILGGIGDIGYTFSVSGPIPAHVDYLHMQSQPVSPEFIQLDLGMIRAIGGLLIGLGFGALWILFGQVKQGNRMGVVGILAMTTLGEGNNALQMFLLDSPFFMAPLSFLAFIWVGGSLWLVGK